MKQKTKTYLCPFWMKVLLTMMTTSALRIRSAASTVLSTTNPSTLISSNSTKKIRQHSIFPLLSVKIKIPLRLHLRIRWKEIWTTPRQKLRARKMKITWKISKKLMISFLLKEDLPTYTGAYTEKYWLPLKPDMSTTRNQTFKTHSLTTNL